MHWGYRILVAYLVFVLVLIVLAFKSFQYKVNLVSEDYYQQEINYQDQIVKLRNEKLLKETAHISYSPELKGIVVQFPVDFSELKGHINLYRPSDATMDRKWDLQLDSQNRQILSTKGVTKGFWKVQINWEDDQRSYYKQQNVYLP